MEKVKKLKSSYSSLLASHSNCLILISIQPDVENLRLFKLAILMLHQIVKD